MKMKMKMEGLAAWLLVAATALGCVRTTSIGRANRTPDAQVDADAPAADAVAERDTGAAADRDVTPTSDAPADLPREAPIIGTGRDATTDGDAADGADGDDAP